MRKILAEFVVVLIFTFGWSIVASAQENYAVRKVVFHGNKTLKKDILLDGMVLEPVSYLQKLLTKDEPSLYSTELINIDLKRLVSIYQSEGFLDAQAEVKSLKINDKRNTVKIIIQIQEGEPILIDTVSIHMISDSAEVDLELITKKWL
ncbi:POTRA domain-containing protein [Williamwhitmania taraxaci]|uniref:POTRA domain-containing protein n=1 Tax=Williamwhitmania taraxaci TaxID=1640674 RepID=UPI00147BB04B|nr:POTRA domain-containing protein [Williamwhitmania taraxaci]